MMTTTTQTGPRLTIAGSCEGCAWLRTGVYDRRLGKGIRSAACVHPTRDDGGLIFARSLGPWPMPADCPEQGAARADLMMQLAREQAIASGIIPAECASGTCDHDHDGSANR